MAEYSIMDSWDRICNKNTNVTCVSRRFSAFASVPVEAALDWNELPEVVRSSY